eukprot:gene8564-1348_t
MAVGRAVPFALAVLCAAGGSLAVSHADILAHVDKDGLKQGN